MTRCSHRIIGNSPCGLLVVSFTCIALASLFPAVLAAQDANVSFSTDIAPVLLESCNGCHLGGQQASGGLRMDNYAALMRGGGSGAVIDPRQAADSLIVRKLTGEGIPVPFYHAALRLRGVDLGVPRGPHLCYSQADVDRITVPIEEAIRLEESLTA